VPETEDRKRQRERRFCDLYQAYYQAVLAYAVRRVAAPQDADDVVADVFTVAWRRIEQVPPAPEDRLWLYGVARRVVAGRHRSARRLRRLTTRLTATYGAGPAQHPQMADLAQDHLLTIMGRLPAAEREALQLVLWEQLTHAEAAQVLGCSVNAIGIRVHRARVRLRALLAPAAQQGHDAAQEGHDAAQEGHDAAQEGHDAARGGLGRPGNSRIWPLAVTPSPDGASAAILATPARTAQPGSAGLKHDRRSRTGAHDGS
jgi:RNA polymerase sigma-70 factor (ECF subfamily)